MSTADFVSYQIRNATIKRWPFPHFFIENVFPDPIYKQILASLPPPDGYETQKSAYKGRKFADPTQNPLLAFMQEPEFAKSVLSLFAKDYYERFPDTHKPKFTMDLRLVRDGQGYSIGPHTDAKWKVISLLFYLPDDYSMERLGTSIYLPKNPDFRCLGGPHHKFADFNLVTTAPFIPNSCFGFWKTDNAFHGVEPITIPCVRDILLWNLYDETARV